MSGRAWHLAQVNVGRIVAPLESPQLQGFVDALDRVNALAEDSQGFVWRLQTEDGNATAFRVLDDDMTLVNMSVWESIDALADFVYRSAHVEIMRRRAEWFERMPEAYLALWWLPADTLPGIADAETRLVHLRDHGPSPFAFTFRAPFPPPGETGSPPSDDRWACPTG
jgi:hypothetical protein